MAELCMNDVRTRSGRNLRFIEKETRCEPLVAKKWEIRNAVAAQVRIPDDGLDVINDLKDLIGTRLEIEFNGDDQVTLLGGEVVEDEDDGDEGGVAMKTKTQHIVSWLTLFMHFVHNNLVNFILLVLAIEKIIRSKTYEVDLLRVESQQVG